MFTLHSDNDLTKVHTNISIQSPMASFAEFGDDHIFPLDYGEFFPSTVVENAAIWDAGRLPSFGDGAVGFELMPGELDENVTSTLGMSFGERFAVPIADMTQPVMPEFDIGLCNISEFQNFGTQFQHESDVYPETSNTFATNFQPANASSDAWAYQCITEETSIKVRPYSVEERKDRIHRYLKKRNQRNFNKTIKYACRKALADRRIRVRGRFARNNELGVQPMTTKKNIQEEEEYYENNPELKHNGEEWLQEAVTSLMYLPIFAG